MDDLTKLLADFTAEYKNLHLDLTSIFQEEAGKGAKLDYLLNTHWNQPGRNQTAQTIYNFIREMLQDIASRTPET